MEAIHKIAELSPDLKFFWKFLFLLCIYSEDEFILKYREKQNRKHGDKDKE